MTPTLLIIGLGNPGKEYEGTRHNVGFDVVDAVVKNSEFRIPNSEWCRRSSLSAEILEGTTTADRVVVFAKPTTYMNESGKAVAALIKQFVIRNSSFVIIHDDLDLPVGTIRLSLGGSSGGQKGVQSIIDTLGTNDFLRLRIGIGPNETPDGNRIPAEHFVLAKFRPEERPKIDTAIARAIQTIDILLRDGLPAAQQFANA